MALKNALCFLCLTCLLGCSTLPSARPTLPPDPAQVLDRARQALKDQHPVEALGLLLNQPPSPDRQSLIQTAVQDLVSQHAAAEKQPDRARILEDSLAVAGFPLPGPVVTQVSPPGPAPAASPSAETMLKGMVTVQVNKGLKVEKGVGAPEIVIGSGFFISADGYLLTNYHVISSEVDPKYEGYSHLSLKLSDSKGEKVPAKVVGWDENFDIALLKAEVAPGYVFQFAPDPQLNQGEMIRALGSPGGLDSTLTSGIISATKRRFLPMGDAIQVDVAINPGNSGGPLINAAGQVLGICFAGIAEFQGVNFAIPGSYIKALLPHLRLGGAVTHHWLGLGLVETVRGLEVSYLQRGSPVENLGIKPGDLLKTVNGRSFATIPEIQVYFLEKTTESLVHLEWESGQVPAAGFASLQVRPKKPLVEAVHNDQPLPLLLPLFGIDAEMMGDAFWSNYLVKRVINGSPADDWGLTPNDPFTIQDWKVLDDDNALVMRFFVKKKTGGYLESSMQVGAYLTGNDFI